MSRQRPKQRALAPIKKAIVPVEQATVPTKQTMASVEQAIVPTEQAVVTTEQTKSGVISVNVPDLTRVDKAADQIQGFRTMVLSAIVATFAVPNMALGGKMYDVVTTPFTSPPIPKGVIDFWPWFFGLPRGYLVFLPWFFALIFLGIALYKLSPTGKELDRYRDALSQLKESEQLSDKKIERVDNARKKIFQQRWEELMIVHRNAFRWLYGNLVLVSWAIVTEFVLALLK